MPASSPDERPDPYGGRILRFAPDGSVPAALGSALARADCKGSSVRRRWPLIPLTHQVWVAAGETDGVSRMASSSSVASGSAAGAGGSRRGGCLGRAKPRSRWTPVRRRCGWRSVPDLAHDGWGRARTHPACRQRGRRGRLRPRRPLRGALFGHLPASLVRARDAHTEVARPITVVRHTAVVRRPLSRPAGLHSSGRQNIGVKLENRPVFKRTCRPQHRNQALHI